MLQYGFLFCLKKCMIIHELSEIMTRRSLYERKGVFGNFTYC